LKIKEYAKKHIAAASEEMNAAIKTFLIFILFSKRFYEFAPVINELRQISWKTKKAQIVAFTKAGL